ncbi:hypothetical protein [Methylibium rhizosphaerae]|jgi:hypothetical protein|uniref:hypothetical protein n=1 Tax=Methylibium rhizosphaerae TaxID=2570323 RepID=UPI00112686B5|nr:hypothetical protein [Methylibium rhizosphaerae]
MSDTKHTDSQLAALSVEDQAARPPVLRVALPSGAAPRQFKVLQSRGAPGQRALPLGGGIGKGLRTG